MVTYIKIITNRIMNSKEGKNVSWIIIGRVIQMVLAFIISVFTTRYLGPSNYGIINYVGAYVAFFTAFCTLGINSIIIKELLDCPQKQGQIVGTTIVLRALAGIISTAVIMLIVWELDGNSDGTVVIALLCSLSLVFQAIDTINYWFQSRYQSKIASMASLFAYVVTSLYKIILLIENKSVYWFAFATSVDYIFVAIVLLAAYRKNGGLKLEFSFYVAKKLLKSSYHYILSGIMVAIYMQTDKIMLKYLVDGAEVGYYSLASALGTIWTFILVAIIDSMYPSIVNAYKDNKSTFERKNKQLYSLVIYISVMAAVFITIFGGWAIKIIYGVEYLPAVEPLRIICWYVLFSYLGVARNAWIVCENLQFYLKYMYMVAALVNVILNYVLIPLFGCSGAALASLITQLCTSIIIPLFIKEFRPNVKLMMDSLNIVGSFKGSEKNLKE